MQRKVFLQRNTPKGKHSFLKLFLWSAVALIILVIITPLVTRHKGDKEAARKPIPEKSGMVVKEIPKSLTSVAQNAATTSVDQNADRNPSEPESVTGPTPASEGKSLSAQEDTEKPAGPPLEKNIQVDVSPSKTQADLDAQEKQHAAELAMAKPTFGQQVFSDSPPAAAKANTAQPAVDKEKPGASSGKGERPPLMGPGAKQQKIAAVEAANQKKAKPSLGDGALYAAHQAAAEKKANAKKKEAKKADAKNTKTLDTLKPDSEKKVKNGGGSLFAIQVGSFKEKQNAEEMEHSLEKKGYNVVLKPVSHPKLGQLYVVQLQPVSDESKASTLMMQIRHEEKVKPVMIKVPGGGQ